jgi:hypothetical protein
MKKLAGWACASALAVLFTAAPVSATTIGVFGFVVDSALGPVISVENLSAGGTFSDVVVHLFDGTNDVFDLNLLDVSAFGLQQSVDDLTTLSFDRAALDLNYSLAGSVALHDLTALSFAFDPLLPDPLDPTTAIPGGGWFGTSNSVTIDFTEAGPQPVPEPASLFLVASGLIGVIGARARARAKPRGSQ